MKPKGILFKAEMVRAILDGRKTQTRRVVNPQPSFSPAATLAIETLGTVDEVIKAAFNSGDHPPIPYPTGTVLYVKETWRTWRSLDDIKPSLLPQCADIEYRADNLTPHLASELSDKWRTPLFMCPWAARIWLRVTDVRVERLQDISEADAIAEGIQYLHGRFTYNNGLHESRSAKESYQALWESINGPGSWDANPFVWVYQFERIEKPNF